MGPGGPGTPPPGKKKPTCLIVGGIAAGVVLLLLVGLFVIGSLVGDDSGRRADPPVATSAAPSGAKTANSKPGSSDFKQLKTGECLQVIPKAGATPAADGSIEITHKEIACDAKGVMTYTVGTVGKGQVKCANDNYMEYYQVDAHVETAAPEDRHYTACLVPNFSKGQCYGEDAKTQGWATLPCTDAKAEVKVESVFEVDDGKKCDAGSTQPLNFPQPPRTYCVSRP